MSTYRTLDNLQQKMRASTVETEATSAHRRMECEHVLLLVCFQDQSLPRSPSLSRDAAHVQHGERLQPRASLCVSVSALWKNFESTRALWSEASFSHPRTFLLQRSLLRSLSLASCGISDSDHDDLADCISVAAGQGWDITKL